MIRRTFPAEVTNGQLRFQASLTDLEGRRVMVVLDECESPSKQWPRLAPGPLADDEFDTEQDVNFQRPFRWETVGVSVSDGGNLRPCLALPLPAQRASPMSAQGNALGTGST